MNLSENRIVPPENPTVTSFSDRVSFVCCIEAGAMEKQVIMLADSLRRWGGRFSNCPVFAVQPRLGTPVTRATRERLAQLQVEFVRCPARHSFTWYNNLNKATALAHIEEIAHTPQICWLDSDVIIVDEPTGILLQGAEEFRAMPASIHHDIGVDLQSPKHVGYWTALCNDLGYNFSEAPAIPTQEQEDSVMAMYWQGGVYTYARHTRLAQRHKETFIRRLRGRIASREAGVYFYDQSSLALSVWQAKLTWSVLDNLHNFAINKLRPHEVPVDKIAKARIIHYFGSLWPDFFPSFCAMVAEERPDVRQWLEQYGPLANDLPKPAKVFAWVLRTLRQRRVKQFAKECVYF